MSQGRKKKSKPPDYAAYLLRLWRETSGEGSQWRASLQNPHTGERVGFSSLQGLFTFLEEETEEGLPGSESRTDQERESGGAR
jgi:hypothetical protein